MPPQFKSMNDLVTYLGNLEERLRNLETENENLRVLASRQESQKSLDENAVEKVVLEYFPSTNLIDPNFLKRAFTVWGHFFVANLIVGIIVGIAYACLMMVLFGSVFGNLIQSQRWEVSSLHPNFGRLETVWEVENKMDSWYSKDLGDGILATTPSGEIEAVFTRLYLAAGKPLDMAVFTRHESEGRLQCEVIAYFSPAAKEVAQAFDAQLCEKPSPAELGLLVGDPLAWSVLFPEKK
jgi:hypothetical protein